MKNYQKTLAYFSTKARDFVKQMADGFLVSLSNGKLEIHPHPMAVDPDTGITSMEMLVVKKSNKAEMGVHFTFKDGHGTIVLTRFPRNSRGIMRDPENDMEFLCTAIPLSEKDRIRETLNRYLSY